MNLRHLRRICAARVEALDLPFPFDVHKLCESVERARGRMIRLLPCTLPAGSPSGLCVSTNVGDYIFYESQTSAFHQEHIILHEVGHLLCEHCAPSVSREEVSGLLLPDLDADMVQRVLGRTCYPMWAEQEAEIIASLILAKVEKERRETVSAVSPDVASVVARVERSLGLPRRGSK